MTAPMWMTDCPTEETLAAFIDDRVDAATRRKITEHIAECGECRELVLMAHDFRDEKKPIPFPWWLTTAAGLAVAASLTVFVAWPMLRGPNLGDVVEAAQPLKARKSVSRVALDLPHQKFVGPLRGDSHPESDDEGQDYKLLEIAENEARFGDPHVRGVALLLAAKSPHEVQQSIDLMKVALEKATSEERDTITTDYAAALLALDRWGADDKAKRERDRTALALSEDVWQRKHTAAAGWNRALALGALGEKAAAIQAWNDYLKLDSRSDWSQEAADLKRGLEDDLQLDKELEATR
jgi:hypothetical protein